jgi:hypothetical protein
VDGGNRRGKNLHKIKDKMADDKQGNITVDHQISRGSRIDSKNGKRQNSAEDKMRHNNDTYFAEGICNHMARKWGKEKVVGNVVKTCVGGGTFTRTRVVSTPPHSFSS